MRAVIDAQCSYPNYYINVFVRGCIVRLVPVFIQIKAIFSGLVLRDLDHQRLGIPMLKQSVYKTIVRHYHLAGEKNLAPEEQRRA